MITQECNSCHKELPMTEFRRNKDTYRKTCKACLCARERLRVKEKPRKRPTYKPIENPPEMDNWLYKVSGEVRNHRADQMVDQWQLND